MRIGLMLKTMAMCAIATCSYAQDQFAARKDYQVGHSPVSLCAADFDHLNHADVAVAIGADHKITILKNNSDGTHSWAADYPLLPTMIPDKIIKGDFNSDGWIDLVVSTPVALVVMMNSGVGTFISPVYYYHTNNWYSKKICAADFNNNGVLDLAVAGNGVLTLWSNNGTGVFTGGAGASVTVPLDLAAIAAANLNNDDLPDIVTANSNGSSTFIDNKDGFNFWGPLTFPMPGGTPFDVTTADFDHDGDVDVAVGDNNRGFWIGWNSGVGVYESIGFFPNFSPSESPFGSPMGIVAVDIDGDRWADVITCDYLSAGAEGSLCVRKNLANGNFGDRVTYKITGSANAICTGPFHSNYTTDIAVASNLTDKISTFINNGIGILGSANFTSGLNSNSASARAANGQDSGGIACINWGNNTLVTRKFGPSLPGGLRPIGPASSYATGVEPSSVVPFDRLRNGRPGWLVTNWGSGNISIFDQDLATGNIVPWGTKATQAYPNASCIADFYGNGYQHVVVANTGSHSISAFYNYGSGDGISSAVNSPVGGSSPMALCAVDISADGKPDIVTANNGSNDISFLRNNLDGSFTNVGNRSVGAGPRSVCWADFNKDGLPDLAAANAGSQSVSIVMCTSPGSYGTAVSYPTGGSPYSICAADFDRDGWCDLATANFNMGSVSFLKNNGNGTFAFPVNFLVGSGPINLSPFDVNIDGLPDLLVAEWNSNDVAILYNLGSGVPAGLQGFDAANHYLPNQVCPGWSLGLENGATAPIISGDTLVISTSSYNQASYYVLGGSNVPTGAMSAEFRMKYVSGSTENSVEATAQIGYSRGDGWHNYLGISYDEVFLWTAEGTRGPIAHVNTHNSFHTYRIEVSAGGGIDVYQDGIMILTGALFYHPTYTSTFLWFGDGNAHAYGVSKWTYFKYNYTGVCSCCIGKRGNVNMAGITDLGDLSALVSYLTGGGYVLPCNDAANVNGAGIVDLTDLSSLVSYLTGGGYVLPNCP